MDINERMKWKLKVNFLDLSIAFALFTVSLFLLRLPYYMKVCIWPDEFIYSAYAYSTISNNWLWSTEAMLQPPLFTYIIALLTYFFGGGIEVFRIVSIIFGSLSVWFMYFLGKELFDRRVGTLSAILLCFGSFHILYSRIVMLEATLIFFILASIYYFFKSYKQNSIKYACISGIFLGLTCITKWNGLLLYLVFFLFILWTKKNIHALSEKKFLLIVLISALIQLPVWIYVYMSGENPLYFHLFQRFTIPGRYSVYQKSPGIEELVIQGFNKYIHLLIDESNPATLSLPWYPIFKIVSSFLLVAAILYYLYPVLKAKSSETLVFLYFMVFNIFCAVYKTKFEYYLLWALPAFYIMLSSMSFEFFDHIKSQFKKISSNSVRILTLIFVCIFVFSYISVGSVTPFVNRGELIGYEKQILKIKEEASPEDAIATSFYHGTKYYLSKHDLDLYVFSLYYQKGIDLKMLEEVKPQFILVSEYYYYSFITNIYAKMLIDDYYNLISNEEGILLFERKELGDSEDKEPSNEDKGKLDDEVSCTIDREIFFRSIPKQMTVGKPVNVLIHVKNTGKNPATFFVTLETLDDFIFSSRYDWEVFSLDKGESYRVKFTILPIKQHFGELNVTAKVSLIKSRHVLPSTFIEVDNVSTSVLRIKKTFFTEDIVIFIYILTIIVFTTVLIIKIISKWKNL